MTCKRIENSTNGSEQSAAPPKRKLKGEQLNKTDFSEAVQKRFWASVEIKESDECWVWTGNRNVAGYGRLWIGEKAYRANRVACALHYGEIGAGVLACHSCDNPPCCNPKHLFLGTEETNAMDSAAKGRKPQQKRTHCIHGHEYTPENTHITTVGARNCKACWRAGRARRKAAAETAMKDK